MKTEQVITVATPRGAKINVTPDQYSRMLSGELVLRDRRGEEYCNTVRGLHDGVPSRIEKEEK